MSGAMIAVQTPRTDIRALEEYALGQWSHPVFGNLGGQSNVIQQARPYLYPAVEKNFDAVGELVANALSAALAGVAAGSA